MARRFLSMLALSCLAAVSVSNAALADATSPSPIEACLQRQAKAAQAGRFVDFDCPVALRAHRRLGYRMANADSWRVAPVPVVGIAINPLILGVGF